MSLPNSKHPQGKSSSPHRHVFAVLGPSKIHSVGVFAIKNIKSGADIFPDLDDEIIWIGREKIKGLPREIRKLYDTYCVIKGDKYGCPRSFNSINPSWYINHTPRPNLCLDDTYRLFAARDIRKGRS